MLKKLFTNPHILLLTVIFFALGIRLYDLNYNSPFLDEAIYVMIGKKVFDGTWQGDAPFSWVGGMPLFYPTLSALFYNFGEIVGSRLLNVLLGTTAVYLVFLFTRQLRLFKSDKDNFFSGVTAAFFFAIAPIPLWLSRLAIYDMLSFTFLMISIVLLQKAGENNKRIFYFSAAILLFLSFLAKYTVFIFFPVILIFTLLFAIKNRDHFKNVLIFIISFSLFIISYIGMFYEDLQSFFTNNVSSDSAVAADLIRENISYTNVWYALSFIGLVFLLQKKKYTAGLLFLLSFLPLAANIASQNSSTVIQNTIFTLTLLLPLCSAAVIWFTEKSKKIGYILLSIISIFVLITSVQTVWGLEHAWVNSDNVTNFLQKNSSNDDVLLAELGDVAFVPLRETIQAENMHGPYVFGYNDLEGPEGYIQAFQDGYFTIVQLDGSVLEITPEMNALLQENYTETYRDEPYVVYQRKDE